MNINQIAMGCKPDPYSFKIRHLEHVNGHTIVIANYGGLTFGGNKLMVLRGIYNQFETLDPHFLNEDYPVFARFQPTEEGLILAKIVCNAVNNNNMFIRDPYPEEIINAETEGYLAYWEGNTNPYNLCDSPSLYKAWEEGYKKADKEDDQQSNLN